MLLLMWIDTVYDTGLVLPHNKIIESEPQNGLGWKEP